MTTNAKTLGGRAASQETERDTTLAIELLHASRTNPRTRFNAGPLEELAASILQLGVQTPLHVRPSREQADRYEVIAGERRLRALGIAQNKCDDPVQAEALRAVPVRVRNWDDRTVMEFQLIENLQREDLTPLEEADGYSNMIGLGYTPEEVALKLGRNVHQVYKALKWARLPQLARAAFEEGVMSKRLATLIARIPDERLMLKACLEVVFFAEEYLLSQMEDGEIDGMAKAAEEQLAHDEAEIRPMTTREAEKHLREHYMRSLKDAPFDLTDEELVPVVEEEGRRLRGGACEDCPWRTGANPAFADELQHAEGSGPGGGAHGGAGGIDPRVCTRPDCMRQKLDAVWQRTAAEAAEQGATVLPPEKGADLFNAHGGGSLRYGSKFIDLEDKPDHTLTGTANEKKVKSWEKLLKGEAVPVTVTQDGAGRTRRLVERSVAITAVNEAAKRRGVDSPFAAAAKSSDRPDDYAEQERRRKQQEKRDNLARVLTLRAMVEKVSADGLGLEGYGLLVELAVEHAGIDAVKTLATVLEVEKPEVPKGENLRSTHYARAILDHLWATQRTISELQAVLVVVQAMSESWSGLNAAPLKRAAGALGIAITEMKNRAKDELRAKEKRKAPPAKKPKANEMIVDEIQTREQLKESATFGKGNPLSWSLEEKSAAYAAKSHTMAELVGGMPDEADAEARRLWERERKRVLRASKRVEVEG